MPSGNRQKKAVPNNLKKVIVKLEGCYFEDNSNATAFKKVDHSFILLIYISNKNADNN